jgi:hypothetical protein
LSRRAGRALAVPLAVMFVTLRERRWKMRRICCPHDRSFAFSIEAGNK